MIRNIVILCFLFLLLASCEDKETSRENNPDPEPKNQNTTDSEKKNQEEEKEATSEEKEYQPGPLIVQEELIPFLTQYGKENPEDKIRIKTRFGNIDVKLFHDTPLHRANIIFLIKHHYFEDTFFHRVAPGFVIQGGNSDNASTNKKRYRIGDYLIPSEYKAGHRHVRGAFSAAKYREMNQSDASSPYEFFIVQSKTGAPHLNNEFTVYGKVIDGMDVVDEISKVKTGDAEWPIQNIYIDLEILE